MKVRSMTGFAGVEKSSEAGDLSLTVKSVNHRSLDMHFHLPDELEGLENGLRELVKRHAARGHFQVRILFTPAAGGAGALNRRLLESYLNAFREAAASYGLRGDPDLNRLLLAPGMLSGEGSLSAVRPAAEFIFSAMQEALEILNAFREREGAALAADMKSRAGKILDAAARMEALRDAALEAFAGRLRERLAELLAGVALDPQRLAQEVAILADRSDIAEELTRLKVHASEVSAMLEAGGEVGKKLDFLLQEMARELNTILSKSSALGQAGLELTSLALELRAEVEKIREQAQNLE